MSNDGTIGLPSREIQVPEVPVDLKYAELRLPCMFRSLCADSRFSNDQIGRIVRCIALGSDSMATSDIEAEVLFYQKDQHKRLMAKLRKVKSRRKLGVSKDEAPDQVAETDAVAQMRVVCKDDVPDMFPKPAECAATPKAAEPAESALDAADNPKRTISAKRARYKKNPKQTYGVGDDLFGYAATSTDSDDATKAAIPKSCRVEVPMSDSRKDGAWIPAKFVVFWDNYPRKVAKSDAMKAFTKLIKSQPDVEKFMATTLASLDYWKRQDQWTKDEGKFIPYPATWLNAGHWNDCSDNKAIGAKAAFLCGDAESDADLVKRMMGQ